MTRINGNIKPKYLTDQHLLAEHREIKRITDLFRKRFAIRKFDDIPDKFTLNKGHVKFFLDKGMFTLKRYIDLHLECKRRGFDIKDYSDNWAIYCTSGHMKNWQPDDNDNKIIIDRITCRINESTQIPRYYGQNITKKRAIEILNGYIGI